MTIDDDGELARLRAQLAHEQADAEQYAFTSEAEKAELRNDVAAARLVAELYATDNERMRVDAARARTHAIAELATLARQAQQLEAKVAALRLDCDALRHAHETLLDAAREYQRAFDADDADASDARLVLWALIDGQSKRA